VGWPIESKSFTWHRASSFAVDKRENGRKKSFLAILSNDFRQTAILATETRSLGYFPAEFGGNVATHSGRGFGKPDDMLEHEIFFEFLRFRWRDAAFFFRPTKYSTRF
jgi:hypothetical protein